MSGEEEPECPECGAVDWGDNGLGGRIACESCSWTPKRELRQQVKEVDA